MTPYERWPEIAAAALALGRALAARGWMIATAESCTGGAIAHALTEAAGASDWFERGLVTYANAAKIGLLDVPPQLLAAHGAVSEPVAARMAEGALIGSAARFALSVTGIAGPGGATPDKPVGTVCFGWALAGAVFSGGVARGREGVGDRAAADLRAAGRPAADCAVQTQTCHFPGDRAAVRAAAALHALRAALRHLAASG